MSGTTLAAVSGGGCIAAPCPPVPDVFPTCSALVGSSVGGWGLVAGPSVAAGGAASSGVFAVAGSVISASGAVAFVGTAGGSMVVCFPMPGGEDGWSRSRVKGATRVMITANQRI